MSVSPCREKATKRNEVASMSAARQPAVAPNSRIPISHTRPTQAIAVIAPGSRAASSLPPNAATNGSCSQ
jgi:hypothetical protein